MGRPRRPPRPPPSNAGTTKTLLQEVRRTPPAVGEGEGGRNGMR